MFRFPFLVSRWFCVRLVVWPQENCLVLLLLVFCLSFFDSVC